MTAEAAAIGLPVDELAKSLVRLARGEPADFSALLHDVEVHVTVDGTKVTCHCHSLTMDAAGRPRLADLTAALTHMALEFAIPRSQIEKAHEHYHRTHSPARMIGLHEQAKALFTDLAKSGEGGELLLFALAERMLRLPQLICKMSLKTSTQMHVHGADGAHAGVDPATGRLALYWGESKIYDDPASAIRACLGSLAPMLLEIGPNAANRRDLQLLDRAIDLNDQMLETALRRYLDPLDPASNELEMRGLCLVGFDCDAYNPRQAGLQQHEVVEAIVSQLPAWKASIADRIVAETLGGFAMHMMCVPFPSAQAFRLNMRQALGLARAAA